MYTSILYPGIIAWEMKEETNLIITPKKIWEETVNKKRVHKLPTWLLCSEK